MLVLSLDSTAQTASVALSDVDKFLAGTLLNIGNKHSTTLLPAVEFILKQAGKRVSDIELFALTAGPGSFTGLRIGAATVKGLAFGRDVPCIGVSSLETMAEGLSFADGVVCPMINARHDRYFSAYFSVGGGEVLRLTDDDTLEGGDIAAYLSAKERQVFLTGDGADLFIKAHPEVKYTKIPEVMKYPNAYYAGLIALRIFNEADEDARAGFTAEDLRPIYLRQPQAERELAERNNNK